MSDVNGRPAASLSGCAASVAPWPALPASRQKKRRDVRRNAVSLVAPRRCRGACPGVPCAFHRLSPLAREYPATNRLAVQYR
ncbi:hypothetical protein G6F24_018768 [Rhizopus arrhizus]|nr:hypothetical protein G6F24_018768 [Rhizopus arrhizus]